MREQLVVVGPFQCNCRILVDEQTREAVVVDPGDEPQKILAAITELETQLEGPLSIRALLHTHAHLDHIGGTRAVFEALQARDSSRTVSAEPLPQIALHAGDEPIYQMLRKQGEMFGITYQEPLPLMQYLEHEQELRVGRARLSVIHTPGHSPGGVCFRLHEDSLVHARETVYSGDTLFHGSVGRTDLWGADGDLMIESIKSRLLTLDGDTRVCPGHGPDTRIGVEKKSNPFLR